MKKTILEVKISLLILLLLSFNASITYATSTNEIDDKIKNIQEENQINQEKIEDLKTDINSRTELLSAIEYQVDLLEDEISLYSYEIQKKINALSSLETEINNLNLGIEVKEINILKLEKEILNLEVKNKESSEKFGQIIAYMYMNQNDNSQILQLLLDSKDFYDMLVNQKMIENISEMQLQFLNEFLDDVNKLEDSKTNLNDEIIQLEETKNELKSKVVILEGEKYEIEILKSNLIQKKEAYQNQIFSILSEINATEQEIANINHKISTNNEEIEYLNKEIERMIQEKQKENQSVNIDSHFTGDFLWPLESHFRLITTYFGYDAWRNGNHYGIDIGNSGIGGSNIYAAEAGIVITAVDYNYSTSGYGNYVIIDHGDEISTLYAHAAHGTIKVYSGQEVRQGDIIANVGATGWASGNHLHFEVRVNGQAVDPFNYTYN